MKIFVGYDEREKEAFDTCAYSILTNASKPVEIFKLEQNRLREKGYYTRPGGEPASTQFAFTRFFVPFLCGYEGLAIFVDCDFVFTDDIVKLFDMYENAQKLFNALDSESYHLMCCEHDYIPKSKIKMDGQKQVVYPKKNLASLMLFNCQKCDILTLDYLNTASGSNLHRLEWVDESFVGEIPIDWNYLVGEYPKLQYVPKGLHYTLGGPWFDGYESCDYCDIWYKYNEKAKVYLDTNRIKECC